MSAWPDKFVIGLTGNIATGKSVVRKMLEHVGAFGIDADALANRAIQKSSPGYQPVIDAFGRYLLDEDGQINRARLGQVVFADLEALAELEAIVHPLVRQAINVLIKKSTSKVVVIEAIKLLESPLHEACDVIWVTTSDTGRQMSRLQKQRDMSPEDAELRMAAQSSQEEKVSRADTVILNNSSIESTWEQVRAAWRLLFPNIEEAFISTAVTRKISTPTSAEIQILKARPSQAALIANFLKEQWGDGAPSQEDVMDSFGDKAYLLLQDGNAIAGALGWKVENLVARVDDIALHPDWSLKETLSSLISEVEQASLELQCEISLIFVEQSLAQHEDIWVELGYQPREIQTLDAGAWQEAAIESFRKGTVMLFKQLRSDRVMRPI